MNLPMIGKVVEADFEERTLKLEMSGDADYYAKASEYVLLPKDAWQWLMGLGESFEKPASGGQFWWRSELRKRIADDAQPGGDSQP